VRSAIKEYYSDNFGSDITVTRDVYDSNNTLTTNLTECHKSIYNVTLKKLINGVSVSNLMATRTGTSASVTFMLPAQVQTSGVPLSGKFKV
jgi:hypothetical protein